MGRLVNEVVESLVIVAPAGVGQIRMADFRAQMLLSARRGPGGARVTEAGSNGGVSRSEPGLGRPLIRQAGASRERRERGCWAEVWRPRDAVAGLPR